MLNLRALKLTLAGLLERGEGEGGLRAARRDEEQMRLQSLNHNHKLCLLRSMQTRREEVEAFTRSCPGVPQPLVLLFPSSIPQ